jgi:hypothetical protein
LARSYVQSKIITEFWIWKCDWKVKPLVSSQHPVPHSLLFSISMTIKVELNMKNRTDTLEVGSRAPDFSLGAANREGVFTLGGLLADGVVILEFLRGTW